MAEPFVIATRDDGQAFRAAELITNPDKLPPATLSDLGITRQRLHEALGNLESAAVALLAAFPGDRP